MGLSERLARLEALGVDAVAADVARRAGLDAGALLEEAERLVETYGPDPDAMAAGVAAEHGLTLAQVRAAAAGA